MNGKKIQKLKSQFPDLTTFEAIQILLEKKKVKLLSINTQIAINQMEVKQPEVVKPEEQEEDLPEPIKELLKMFPNAEVRRFEVRKCDGNCENCKSKNA